MTSTLNGRNVEKVALSLFGYFSIQDGFFIQQMLSSLINAEVKSGNSEADKKINSSLAEIRSQYLTPIFESTYLSSRNYFLNCRFFSVPQFITILENSNCNDSFLTELNHTRHLATGSKDWFKEYQFIRKLRSDS